MTEIIEQEATTATLSDALQGIARRYLDARRRTNESFLEAAAALAEARAQAAHGEWYTFLAATNTSEDLADRLLSIHAEAQKSPAFAETVTRGWLPMSQAAIVAKPSTPPEAKTAVVEQAKANAARQAPPPSKREVEQVVKAARPAPPDTSRTGAGSAPPPAKTPLTLTPLAPAAPAGPATVIATVPAAGGLPPLLQLGAPAALPSPLFAPPPVAAAATPAPSAPATGEWVEVDDDEGLAVRVRSTGLSPMVADAVAQVADALRLIALGHAHAVDTQLLLDMAGAVEAEPGQRRGTLRTVLRIVADEADELARQAAPPAAPLPAPIPDEGLTMAAGLSIVLAEAAVKGAAAADVSRWQEALDALAPELDDPTYEGLAHRIGALREAARGEP